MVKLTFVLCLENRILGNPLPGGRLTENETSQAVKHGGTVL